MVDRSIDENEMRRLCTVTVLANFLFIIGLTSHISAEEAGNDTNVEEEDPSIDPYSVMEEGCPIVAERFGLDLKRLDGNWSMPYASLNWLADIGIALHNKSVKMSEISSICPTINAYHDEETEAHNLTHNATWTLKVKCSKLEGIMELRCWAQYNSTKSKFICWNDQEQRDQYMMVSATDHENWIVLVRCMPGEPEKPAEGMSWAILSKEKKMDSDVSDVIFGLLEGYGFDVAEFKTQLLYDDCIK